MNAIVLHPVQAISRALVDCLVVRTRGSIRAALASLHRAASAHKASIQGPACVGGNKRSIVPVDFHTPALRRPGASVPHTAIHSHGLLIWVWEARAGLDILECADGCVVHIKNDDVLVPLEVIGVKISSWVEPEVNLLLPATSAVGENVAMEEVR